MTIRLKITWREVTGVLTVLRTMKPQEDPVERTVRASRDHGQRRQRNSASNQALAKTIRGIQAWPELAHAQEHACETHAGHNVDQEITADDLKRDFLGGNIARDRLRSSG